MSETHDLSAKLLMFAFKTINLVILKRSTNWASVIYEIPASFTQAAIRCCFLYAFPTTVTMHLFLCTNILHHNTDIHEMLVSYRTHDNTKYISHQFRKVRKDSTSSIQYSQYTNIITWTVFWVKALLILPFSFDIRCSIEKLEMGVLSSKRLLNYKHVFQPVLVVHELQCRVWCGQCGKHNILQSKYIQQTHNRLDQFIQWKHTETT